MPSNYTDMDSFRAIGRVMARYAQDHAASADADGVIESAPLLKAWKPGSMAEPASYAAGDVRTDENQPWKCVQAHTHHGEDGWNPAAASARALWAPYHATRREYALPYVPPTNAEDAYKAGEWMIWTDGLAYRCLGNAVTFGPDVLPDAWEVAT